MWFVCQTAVNDPSLPAVVLAVSTHPAWRSSRWITTVRPASALGTWPTKRSWWCRSVEIRALSVAPPPLTVAVTSPGWAEEPLDGDAPPELSEAPPEDAPANAGSANAPASVPARRATTSGLGTFVFGRRLTIRTLGPLRPTG